MIEHCVVSVCVANYNGERVLRQCLQSLRDQHFDLPFEVLVYDDASPDGSGAIVADEFPEFTLIQGESNVGFCAANNIMVARASGDFILLLNNDAWLEADALGTLHAASSRWPDPVLTLPQRDAVDGQLLDCGMGMDVLTTPIPLYEIAEREVATVMGACLWISRAGWERCGGFPEWFESIAEDMYLCLYARLLGQPVVALAGSGYFHHVGHSFGGGKITAQGLATTRRRRALSERNRLFVLALFYPSLGLLLLPVQCILLLFEGLVLAGWRRDWSLFRDIYGNALAALWRRRDFLWRQRQAVQARRAISMPAFFSVFNWLPHKLTVLLRHGVPQLD